MEEKVKIVITSNDEEKFNEIREYYINEIQYYKDEIQCFINEIHSNTDEIENYIDTPNCIEKIEHCIEELQNCIEEIQSCIDSISLFTNTLEDYDKLFWLIQNRLPDKKLVFYHGRSGDYLINDNDYWEVMQEAVINENLRK